MKINNLVYKPTVRMNNMRINSIECVKLCVCFQLIVSLCIIPKTLILFLHLLRFIDT